MLTTHRYLMSGPTRRAATVGVLALVAMLGMPAMAPARTVVSYSSAGLLLDGDQAGEAINMARRDAPLRYTVSPSASSAVADVVVGPGCTSPQANEAECVIAGNLTVTANLRGGDDQLLFGEGLPSFAQASMVVDGGDGADRISGGAGPDELEGGPGADVLDGNGGNDVLAGERGDDTVEGGDGDDLFRADSTSDDISSAALGTDTMRGEAGNDTLRNETAGSPDRFDGGPGADVATYLSRFVPVNVSSIFGEGSARRSAMTARPVRATIW